MDFEHDFECQLSNVVVVRKHLDLLSWSFLGLKFDLMFRLKWCVG